MGTKGSDNNRMNGVNCGRLNQSRHAHEIAPGSTRTEGNTTRGDWETVPKPKPVMPKNNIDLTRQAGIPNSEETQRRAWNKIVQGNLKSAEFTEIKRNGKPLKKTN
jgi:hypothetical protein